MKARQISDSKNVEKSHGRRAGSGKRWIIIVLLVAICVFVGFVFADWYQTMPEETVATYVGRGACIDCHQEQANLFHGSHHDLAMDLATDQSVLANFDGQEIEHYGVTSKVFRDGDKFMVRTEGRTGEMEDFQVKYVFGVEPLQQYMVELDPPMNAKEGEVGRVQVLRLSWDTAGKKWFYLSPPDVDEKIEPTDPLHWTGITQCWNASCADCHSTNLKKNFVTSENNYHTTFSEIDVSCESCHGPGSTHVELANKSSIFWDRKLGYGLAKLKTTSNLPQIESCAPCHSRRTVTKSGFVAGCNFDDYHSTQLLSEQIYHDDGQIRDEVYVYGSFTQSKMFHKGIRCTDCHDPHSVKLKHDGNQVCTSCHQHPSGKYDSTAHHHHEMGTEGAMCVSCHMPHTTYMSVDSRRDHSFRVPRPDQSVLHQTPNACTACHLDQKQLASLIPDEKPNNHTGQWQYLDWIMKAENGDSKIAEQIAAMDQAMLDACLKWYPPESSPEKTKYYEQYALGRSGKEEAVDALVELANDRRAPAIFRASAALELADDPSAESLAAAIEAVSDSDSKVVSAALIRLDFEVGRIADRARYSESQAETVKDLRPLVETIASALDHESHRVRLEAARIFASIPTDLRDRIATANERSNFARALSEYEKSLLLDSDRASNHLMLAGIYELTGRLDRAKTAYQTAIQVEPNLAGPRSNLSALLESEAMNYRRQIQQRGSQGGITPTQMQAMMKRAQELNQLAAKFRSEEHELLRTDLKRSEGLANTHGLHYRFGMSSYLQNDVENAEKHLRLAHELAPDIPTYLLGLATFYDQMNDPQKAVPFVNQLIKLDPKHPGYRSLASSLNEKLKLQK